MRYVVFKDMTTEGTTEFTTELTTDFISEATTEQTSIATTDLTTGMWHHFGKYHLDYVTHLCHITIYLHFDVKSK